VTQQCDIVLRPEELYIIVLCHTAPVTSCLIPTRCHPLYVVHPFVVLIQFVHSQPRVILYLKRKFQTWFLTYVGLELKCSRTVKWHLRVQNQSHIKICSV